MCMINVTTFIHRDMCLSQRHVCCHAELTVNGKTDLFPLLLTISAFIVYFPSRMCNFNILLFLGTKDKIFPLYDCVILGVLSHLMLGHD